MKSPLESHQQKCSQGELSSLVPVSGSLDRRDALPPGGPLTQHSLPWEGSYGCCSHSNWMRPRSGSSACPKTKPAETN